MKEVKDVYSVFYRRDEKLKQDAFFWNMFLLTPFCENDHETRNTVQSFSEQFLC
jgi:hypothetical protein